MSNVGSFLIDHKKVIMTAQEYEYYKSLCREYDRTNFKGEQLFSDHFETDDHGIIIFVKPPSKKYSSIEVYCYLTSIMINQHLRINQEQCDAFVKESKSAFIKTLEEINQLKEELKQK